MSRGRTVRVAIIQGTEPRSVLGAALTAAGFWRTVERVRRAAAVTRARLRILIKPDLACYDHGSPAGTNPALVEHLIELLHRRGYGSVVVGAASDAAAAWLENRAPPVAADLLGYRFATAGGRPYQVVDLSDDQVPGPFTPDSVLAGCLVGRAWRDAHLRISFATVKTDDLHGFVLGAESLCDVLPVRDAQGRGRHGLTAADVCLALLAALPPEFAILDAIQCSHGQLGACHPRAFDAGTIIASEALLLADWAAASKMGLEPDASPVNAAALARLGLPAAHRVIGDLEPWPRWRNANPFLTAAAPASRALRPWLTTVNTELFPFRDPIDARINAALAGVRSRLESPAMQYGLWAVHSAIRRSLEAAQAARMLIDKERLARVDLPLGVDLSTFAPEDFEAVEDWIEPLSAHLANVPMGPEGFRRVRLDDSIVFEFTRTIPVPYAEFVARVDICQAISYMNDYLGGRRVDVRRDRVGRIVHQAERNVYLPQPNYLVLSGGQPIDVTKVEVIRYRHNEQQIYWRTVKSENGSASYDDGSVSFRLSGTATTVTVLGRQQFALPPIWRAIRIRDWPGTYDVLVDHAYRTFFRQTMANFEAAYEGRNVRIGRPPAPPMDENQHRPSAWLIALGRQGGQAADRLGLDVSSILAAFSPPPARPGALDEEGFRHVRPREELAKPAERSGLTGSLEELVRQLTQVAAPFGRRFARELDEAWRQDWADGNGREL